MRIRRAYCDTPFGQVHYRVAGNEQQPTLLLLHQSPSSSVMYESMMAELADHYYLLAPDTPGFGNSDALERPVSVAAWAGAIKAFLDVLGVKQCFVFGHHTGASIAVQLEYDHPGLAVAMALSGPTLLSDELKKALPGKATAFPLAEDGSHLLGMWQRMRAKEPDAPMGLSLRETLLGLSVGEAYPDAYQAVIEQDFAGQISALQCPILVFAGDKDPLFGQLDAAHALLQKGEKQVLSGARTYACDLYAQPIAALIDEFYKRHINAEQTIKRA